MEDDGTLSIGTRLGEFEIRGLVGIGGFGIVYRAFDHDLEREVAIKEYMPGLLASRTLDGQVQARGRTHAETFEAGRRSFMAEAKMLARFDHPALVKVFRFWEGNGTAYMVMPLYTGQTLAQVLKQLPGPPTEAWLMGVLVPLLGALEALHSQQIFHRDVSPDNILLLRNGRPVLLDFGAARQVISDRTQTLTAILKPNYAPIEQYAEVPSLRQGPWTDLYALGAVVYASLTGKPPPPAAARAMQDELVPLTEVAARLEAERGQHYSAAFLDTWQQALAVRPTERPQSVRELMQQLGLMPASTGFDDDSTVIAPAVAAFTTRPPARMPDGDHTVVVTGMGMGMKFDPVAPTGHDMRMVPPGSTRRSPTPPPAPTRPPTQHPATRPPPVAAPPAPSAATPGPPLPTPEQTPRPASRGGLVTAMLVTAVVLGIGGYLVMRPSGSTTPSAAASAPATPASAAAEASATASARPTPPMITEYPENIPPTSAGAGASPATTASAAAAAAASRPDGAALAAAARASAAAFKASAAAAARAEAASKAAAAAAARTAALPPTPTPTPTPVTEKPASTPRTPSPASDARPPAPAGPRSPDEVCGKRVFIARDMCIQEACTSAEFSRHPICADLRHRAEEERRRELYGG